MMSDAKYGERRARNQAIGALLARAVEEQVVPGVAALVVDRDGSLFESYHGVANVDNGLAMGPTTILRLASMTKLLTNIVAWKQLGAHGYSWEEPVGEILPEFDELPVLTGFDGDVPLLRPPSSRATLGQLLTHSSGLAYDLWNADVLRYEEVEQIPGMVDGSRRAFLAPLVADPGTQFNYGNSTDWLGLVVEAVSGKELGQLYEDEVTGPLGMTDTVGVLSEEQRSRLAPAHVRAKEGRWVTSDIDYARSPEFLAGGHALYSTGRDFMALQRVLLNEGEDERGNEIIPRSLVKAMSRNQLSGLPIRSLPSAMPEIVADLDFDEAADGWGPGLLVSGGRVGGRMAGSFGWLGMYNTAFWIDPVTGVAASIYCQAMPFLEPPIRTLLDQFERAVYS